MVFCSDLTELIKLYTSILRASDHLHPETMLIEDFNRTIGIWITALEAYNCDQLTARPSSTSWSIGQVYMHLLDDTSYYIEQIKSCVMNNDHASEQPTSEGKIMLLNNDFPDEILEGAPSNAYMPQPESKEQLVADVLNLKTAMNSAATLISKSSFHGKARHPGLGYFSADEWLQFADMHFRHHLRQKKRIDTFLEGIRGNT
jgi:DinB superfamily